MLELNKIYLGDSYELIKQIPDKSVDCVYTDIPYLHDSHGGGKGELATSKTKNNIELKGCIKLYEENKNVDNKGALRIAKNMKQLCDELGMRFYVSDAHFKECSNNCCCCALNKNWDYSRGNFASALQIAKKCGVVKWSDIEKDMYFLNFQFNDATGINYGSSERLAKFKGMTMKDYLHYLWNDPKMGQSPYKIFEKVLIPDGYDEDGNIIYKYNGNVTFEKCKEQSRDEILETRV